MSGACSTPLGDPEAIRDVVNVVDCNARSLSEAGYHVLSGPHSVFPAALTAILTIYVAVLGYRLLLGDGPRLAEAPLAALKVGAILALTLNWNTFQTLVFDLAFNAPLEVAHMVGRPAAPGTRALRDPLGEVQAAYTELTLDAAEFGKSAGQEGSVPYSRDGAAANALWKASGALFASTAGVLSIASIAAGVLTAIGPIFIALFLLDVTRGLFVGWVRALATAALAPALSWLTTSVMLIAIHPGLTALADQRAAHQLQPDTATAVVAMVFVFAGAQLALILASGVIAGGFRIGGLRPQLVRAETAPQTGNRPESQPRDIPTQSRPQQLAWSLQHAMPTAGETARRIEIDRPATVRGQTLDGPINPDAWRTARLGEDYRRGRFQDRSSTRLGARS